MANSAFTSALRSFWHTMTSYDRHSSFDSPHRTGRHVPLSDARRSILTGVATASDSRPDITAYSDEAGRNSPRPTAGHYSPGMRSTAAQQTEGFETQSSTDVPMQSFQDGLPPPPPVRHSWKRIDSWAEDNYPELYDQLGEGATNNDLNDLEHQLDCSLPHDVRESLMIHDGQERGGNPTGIIFGSMLLDCEEIVQEWETWRRVYHQFLLDTSSSSKPSTVYKTPAGGSSEASSSRHPPSSPSANAHSDEWRHSLLSRQESVPPGAVQKAYAHVGWIPLVRDWGGNNLAIDLAPGPSGRWGQVILFGRDYDTKYVVARSWAAFLALVADDLNSGKWHVDDETGELRLQEFRKTRVEPPYFSILRWRMDQKHGRRAAKRASMAGPLAGTSPRPSRSASPYASPVDGTAAGPESRGRSMQRLSGSSPKASPMRPIYGKPPPLTRVAEERTIQEIPGAEIDASMLVEVESPRASQEGKNGLRIQNLAPPPQSKDIFKDKENEAPETKLNGKQRALVEESMKTIEI